jgi:N-acetylmuramoyl-L-alanine amidase
MLSLPLSIQKNTIIMQKLILICTLLFCSLFALAGDKKPYFHQITIKSGDAISTILERYDLEGNECNVAKFYELNKMKKGSKLLADKSYFLPVKIYSYNGASIRSTLDIDDVDLAIEIQKYNESLHKKGLMKKSFKKSKELWVPYHVECDKSSNENIKKVLDKKKMDANEEGNTSSKSKKDDDKDEAKVTKDVSNSNLNSSKRVYELFGDKYSNVNMFGDQLQGEVFYISSGHGGPDPGAQCDDLDHTLCEDEYAYDVALRLARDLTQHGATVHMIIQDENDGIRDDEFLMCDSDESCNGKKLPVRQLDRLKQRADHINRLYAKYKKQGVKKQTAVMVHVDSRAKEKKQDTFFYYYEDEETKKKANKMQEIFESKYDAFQKGRGYHGYVDERGLYMLRKVDPTAVYIELANIRNKSDHVRLMEYTNRQALANWLFEGLTGLR